MAATDLREFLWGLGSLIAVMSEARGVPAIALPPRGSSPAAHAAAVDAAIAETCAGLDELLARKRIPPTRTRTATLGRELVSNREVLDTAKGMYTPGPGLAAMATAMRADAANTKETK
ncbi:hypothetical protein H7J08_00995 [Mycobacterium frederiksbergense]|uniref:hypothetical protein n=1 Tax=Mycolicibacterium frederiksbergense TaxID=117567 RepID=UPI0021F2C575|nr:hypothetical protein [Mycolicibacterium frederiksbergense]MCV7043254.1 hypothetical protein [Mycolicibacterium frederiksbergense]